MDAKDAGSKIFFTRTDVHHVHIVEDILRADANAWSSSIGLVNVLFVNVF